MCGICGKLILAGGGGVDRGLIREMCGTLRHRGPDDEGMYLSGRVGLGHRRLAIIDLESGKQPITNELGTTWVVFNGEIYNYRELRDELVAKGHRFRTKTDTEVIVHLYEQYGPGCVSRLQGMFAIALWDEQTETLLLARDRVGIKPLYTCLSSKSLLFASEMKAILVDPSADRSVSPEAVDMLLRYHYLPGETTLFRSIRKVLPGHYLLCRSGEVTDVEYWDLAFPAERRQADEAEIRAELIELLRTTVKSHMISDVPVGFLLSGGVDSTALLSFAVEQTDRPISTFTIGFDAPGFADERPFARLAAQRFGTRHYDMTMTAADFARFLPGYVRHMEEPVCEPPALALHYVTQLASRHVKVLLSGEGGDEAFAGYPSYHNVMRLERLKQALGPASSAAGSLLLGARTLLPARVEKIARLMQTGFDEYYSSRTATAGAFGGGPAALYTGDFRRACASAGRDPYRDMLLARCSHLDLLDRMLYIDTKTWLPDDLLIKADKITMASSVELRVPLLDHKVLEYAASLPPGMKLRGATTKYILKQAFAGRVPEEIIARRKTGFPVPYDTWLAHELKGYTADTLLDQRALGRGYFDRGAVTRLLDPRRPRPAAKEIFLLLVLELWHRAFVDTAAQVAVS